MIAIQMDGFVVVDELNGDLKSRSSAVGKTTPLTSKPSQEEKLKELETKIKRRDAKIDELKQRLEEEKQKSDRWKERAIKFSKNGEHEKKANHAK
ncbi:hypothetical protein EB796_012324 [Bugula neritina]|uniref:Uncharacterized protein n=1 Tax=Bugula neritina TaxID=10212 RepID=A0A7J7JUN0_BUGNE|nr:hypothetical protein EB796_012324 [Bugula neritina]